MSGQLLGIQQIDTMRSAAATAIEAKDKAWNILKNMKSLFDSQSLNEHSVSIQLVEDDFLLGTLSSSYGIARLRMSSVIGENQFLPTMVAERRVLDKYDEPYWEEIFRLHFPRYETAFAGSPESKLNVSFDGFGSRKDESLYLVGMNIAYRIVSGPGI